MMDAKQVKNIVEACLLVAGRPMSLRQIDDLFEGDENRPDKETLKGCIEELQNEYEGRGIELVNVASGYRLQSRSEVSEWVARLFPEKPPRYSRALLETLVLVAYRQPITRGEIEEIRGVAVSSNIVKTLQERQWVKEVGFKDVPGKPALLGTTKQFLDYFNLKRLDDLPPLSEIKDFEEMDAALMEAAGLTPEAANDQAVDGEASESQEGDTPEVFAAGEANQVDVDLSDESKEASDADADDTKEGPVTFAGLVSNLPSLDEETADQNLNIDVKNDDDAETNQDADAEVTAADEAAEQPDAESKMLSSLSELAEEHKQEIEVRDELESQLPTRYTESTDVDDVASNVSEPEAVEDAQEAELVVAEAGEEELTEDAVATDALGDAIDASSTSPDVLSDTFSGDPPNVGDTLH